MLEVLSARLVEISDAGGVALGVGLDVGDGRVGTDFAASGFECDGNDAGERARLRAHFTSKEFAKSAVHAGAASVVRLRQDGDGSGIRVPSEFAGGTFEKHARGFNRHGGKRIRLGTPGVKGIRAGLARDADLPIHFSVIGFEVGVGDGPVGEACSLRWCLSYWLR